MVKIAKLSSSGLEKLVKKIGWTKLRWGPAGHAGLDHGYCMKKRGGKYYEFELLNVGWILHGCPPNYKGEYEDYIEDVILQIENKRHKHLRYRWAKKRYYGQARRVLEHKRARFN